MNPKDMTGRALFIASKDSYSSKKQHAGISLLNWIKDQEAIELELLRRLDEADALRKENEELKAQNLLIRGDNADLLANADAYSFNISNMHTKMLQLLEENVELRKDKGQLEIRDF